MCSIAYFGTAQARSESGVVSGVVAVSTGPMRAFTQSIGRELGAGDDVFLNDEVETGKKTRAQVLLRDESVFSLAPSSKVVFDQFIYDPSLEEGVLEASLVRGGMRFVSGQLAKNTPENIKIRAGEATVGIRGTEIMAKHDDDGSTFVLLSGSMEVTTVAGSQLVNRPGFGIDVSADGLLGAIRQVPLAEINAILSAPAQQAGEADAESASNEGDDADAEEEAEAETAENEASDTDAADSDSAEGQDTQSDFDNALTASASESSDADGGGLAGLAGLADIADAAPELETPNSAAPTISPSETVASIVDSLAEDRQVSSGQQAQEAIQASNQLTIYLSQNNVSSNPYFSSTANVVIRASAYFETGDTSQFGITRDLLREKFPDASGAGATDGFVHLSEITSNNLANVDAVLIYADANEDALTAGEQTLLQSYVSGSDAKKVITIGRQRNTLTAVNNALAIYSTTENNGGGDLVYSYTADSVLTSDLGSMDDRNAYNATHKASVKPVSGSSSSLLAGVNQFAGVYDGGAGFRYLTFSKSSGGATEGVTNGLLEVDGDLAWPSLLTLSDLTTGPFLNNGAVYQGLDFGDQGAAYFGRFSCSANAQDNGAVGASVNFNFVDDGRLQLCRNLVSSMAPDDTLVDIEIGSLSASEGGSNVTYALTNHTDLFKIIGDKLLLKAGATPAGSSYTLTIDATLNGSTRQSDVTVNVQADTAETRIAATREVIGISNGAAGSADETINVSSNNLKTDVSDISWITLGSPGTPGQTGKLTLHYRETVGGQTYDRFHEIEVNYDCASDNCSEFATSMDTQNELIYGSHFSEQDFGNWTSFFDRFTSGTGNFRKTYNFTGGTDGVTSVESDGVTVVANNTQKARNADYTHALSINYGARQGVMNTAGSFDGTNGGFDVTWSFDFLDSDICTATGACSLKMCDPSNGACAALAGRPDADSVFAALRTDSLSGSVGDYGSVQVGNLPLPNDKHALAVKSRLGSAPSGSCNSGETCRTHITNFEVMTPH